MIGELARAALLGVVRLFYPRIAIERPDRLRRLRVQPLLPSQLRNDVDHPTLRVARH